MPSMILPCGARSSVECVASSARAMVSRSYFEYPVTVEVGRC